ncbi:MAG: DUF1178 family protein [Rhodospirillaceae bacterium]
MIKVICPLDEALLLSLPVVLTSPPSVTIIQRVPSGQGPVMILYSLRCDCGHEFDQWFDNMADYESRTGEGALSCPTCGGHHVVKAIMAPRLGKSQAAPPPPPCGAPSCGNAGACPMMGQF